MTDDHIVTKYIYIIDSAKKIAKRIENALLDFSIGRPDMDWKIVTGEAGYRILQKTKYREFVTINNEFDALYSPVPYIYRPFKKGYRATSFIFYINI